MINEERLKALRFQAANYGLTESVAARIIKEGKRLQDQSGMMVMIAVSELQEFLSHYPEEQENAQA